MGKVIVSNTFNPHVLAKPGDCVRISMIEVSADYVKKRCQRGLFLLEMDVDDQYGVGILHSLLAELEPPSIWTTHMHSMEQHDTLFVCSTPGNGWFQVTLLNDLDLYRRYWPNLDNEAKQYLEDLQRVGGPITQIEHAMRARGEVVLANLIGEALKETCGILIRRALKKPTDLRLQRIVAMRTALEEMERNRGHRRA